VLFDSPRAFHLRDGTGATLATPNCYLCSTFVRPESRGGGLGTSLYSRRLEFVNKLERSTVAIEIMGTGVPMQIESSAMVGFRFHVAAGFEIAGYSAEDDHGPLLICRH
jgi:GNAT superfamily N-acetyltransferase